MITTSMVADSGLVNPPIRGMSAAAFQAIEFDARTSLAGNGSKKDLRRVLQDIADLAAAELSAEEKLDGCWQMTAGES